MKKAFLFAIFLSVLCFSLLPPRTAEASGGLFVAVGDKIYSFSAPQLKGDGAFCRLSGKDDEINGICFENRIEPKNAEIFFNPNRKNPFSFSEERTGKTVDEEKLREDIDAALSVGGGSVTARLLPIEPKVTVADLKKLTFERGRFTTYFESSSPERISNVKLAAKAISGKAIESGETFSFNETVGERSEKRGYKTAKIIKGGRFEDGLGGGVCQVSTTLYNAALLSGLKVTESHPHSLAVSYVENSFDAMVSFGSADLKFANDTGGKIFIAAYVDSRSLTFVIFGEKMRERIERVSVVNEVIYPKETVEETAELSEGETRRKVQAKKGYKSTGYLVVERNGKKSRTLIRKDRYDAVDGVTEIGRAVGQSAEKSLTYRRK